MIDILDKNIVYVTRDIERALGISPDTKGYHIISNSTEYAKSVAGNKKNILLIENDTLLDTRELLLDPSTIKYINGLSNPHIIVFKNTLQIEKICKENEWTLLNPSAHTANIIEEKISQVEWLGEAEQFLPSHSVVVCKKVQWEDAPFILQFNRAHTGSGTLLIQNKTQLEELQKTFPDRPVRITEFIDAPTYTLNVVIDSDGNILPSSPSLQITGLAPFTGQPFATVGNDWSYAHISLSKKAIKHIHAIIESVGKRMHESEWRGLFGIDFLVQKDTVYLMEINARQPASTTFESQLQKVDTTFEAHIAALLGTTLKEKIIAPVETGAQIILRNSDKHGCNVEKISSAINELGYTTILYNNIEAGSDLLRIQTNESFMKNPTTPNANLETISSIILQHRTQKTEDSDIVSAQTLALIDKYLHLSIGQLQVVCPYYNNKRAKVRAGLRPLIGKGMPFEIIEEAEITALREKQDISTFNEDTLTAFLVDHNLGVDCSAFVFYLLNSELEQKKHKKLANIISFPRILNPLRILIRKMRIVENINVKTLAREENSHAIELVDVQPGDIITIRDAGVDAQKDHVMFIYKIDFENKKPKTLYYVHSFQWSTDGKYNHGVRKGKIEIINTNKSLIEQHWIEQEKEGNENETLKRAKEAKNLSIRRLNALT